MSFWSPRAAAASLISPAALATFGRAEFLGNEEAGISVQDAYALIASLTQRAYAEPSGRAQVIAELRRHAEHGEWEKVGAWQYVREFMSDEPDTRDLIDGGLLAVTRMRVTNLSIHLAPVDVPRYRALTGGPPPHDGFFGPPVFDSEFGPGREFYLDDAVAAAAARKITRLPAEPGVAPGPVRDAARAMWDFGLLIYRGPRVVSPDIRFEPSVVRPAVAAASHVDHAAFTDQLAQAALDLGAHVPGAWPAIGGARFAEDYLDTAATQTTGYARLLDTGLTLLTEMGEPGLLVAPGLLTPRQRQRLAELR
jgi:hypothetical protein